MSKPLSLEIPNELPPGGAKTSTSANGSRNVEVLNSDSPPRGTITRISANGSRKVEVLNSDSSPRGTITRISPIRVLPNSPPPMGIIKRKFSSNNTNTEPPKKPRKNNAPLAPTLEGYIGMYNKDPKFRDFVSKSSSKANGSGGTANVYIVTIDEIKYAMKRVRMVDSNIIALYNEIRALRELDTLGCAPTLHAVVVDGEYINLFLSYTEGQTLEAWLKEEHSDEDRDKIQDELTIALTKIHASNFIHADVKPSNIWIPTNPSIPAYFLDFGSAIKLGEKATSFTRKPTESLFNAEKVSQDKNTTDLKGLFEGVGGTRHKRKKLNLSRRRTNTRRNVQSSYR